DMAQHLHAFLQQATPGPGGTDINDKNYEAADPPFTDINNETKNTYDAITVISDLGITTGQTHTTYNPTGPVTRAQMASFITRTMDHTNTRPQGLTIQGHKENQFEGDPISASVSLRDINHLPIQNAVIDTFYHKIDDDIELFDDNGNCNDGTDQPIEDGCDLGLEATNENGNLEITLDALPAAEEYRVYIWTGDEGEFDLNESEHTSIDINVNNDAAALKVTSSHGIGIEGTVLDGDGAVDNETYEGGVYAEYGETVTVTIQLVDKINTDGTAADDNAKPVAKPGVELTVAIYKNDGDGSTENSTMTHKTDDDGKIQLTFTKNDPKPDDDGNIGTVIVTVTESYTSNTPPTIVRTIQWSDAEAEATTIKLSSTRPYVKLPADEGKRERVIISSQVLDQYGDPIKQAVTLLSTAGGKHSDKLLSLFHVTYMVEQNDTGAAQRFGAWFGEVGAYTAVDLDEGGSPPDTFTGTESSENGQTVYWAVKNDDLEATPIVHVDEAEKTIVVSSGADNASYAVYDSDDQFTFEDNPVLMSKFEEELDKGDMITWTINEGVSIFNLSPN
ncbi:MAG: S-layer homology domain-containing protein, partial [bacterium]|nr:S-layer homology domain-containing protein [bacterium]